MDKKVKKFNTILKELRAEKGFSQSSLALKINVKRNTISNYENGISSPDFQTLTKIVKVLDTTADFLLGIESAQKVKPGQIAAEPSIEYTSEPKPKNKNITEEQFILDLYRRFIALESDNKTFKKYIQDQKK